MFITTPLSAREEVVAGVALGVVKQLGPGKAADSPEQEVAGVAAKDPVVGPLVIVPVAAPARVGHGVEEVVAGHPGGGLLCNCRHVQDGAAGPGVGINPLLEGRGTLQTL